MKVLAIDPGTSRCGLAVSDELGMLAHPLEAMPVRDGSNLSRELAEKAKEVEAGTILVGYPLGMDGTEGPRASAASSLAAEIRNHTKVDVELVDERLTTVEASRRLHEAGHSSRKQKGRIDSAAAAVLLQAWLDSRPGQQVQP